mmetsp:Transcript_3216/g.2688  ORF Transcript_3216/g.2688 Transcript_3216/m.2688 type:complete len:102 (+) Transcript_3216:2-307(+)
MNSTHEETKDVSLQNTSLNEDSYQEVDDLINNLINDDLLEQDDEEQNKKSRNDRKITIDDCMDINRLTKIEELVNDEDSPNHLLVKSSNAKSRSFNLEKEQ